MLEVWGKLVFRGCVFGGCGVVVWCYGVVLWCCWSLVLSVSGVKGALELNGFKRLLDP